MHLLKNVCDPTIPEDVFREVNNVFISAGHERLERAVDRSRYTRGVTKGNLVKELKGHDLVETLFFTDRLFISELCTNYLLEITNYENDPETHQARDWGDHAMDGQRMLFNTFCGYIPPRYETPDVLDWLYAPKIEDKDMEYLKAGNRWADGKVPERFR